MIVNARFFSDLTELPSDGKIQGYRLVDGQYVLFTKLGGRRLFQNGGFEPADDSTQVYILEGEKMGYVFRFDGAWTGYFRHNQPSVPQKLSHPDV